MLRLLRSKKVARPSLITAGILTQFNPNLRRNNMITRNFSLRDAALDQQLHRMSDFDELNPSENRYGLKTRDQHREEILLDNEYDVLIVGGGATGAGTALSVANAGLRALVVDSYDYCSGASSKSSKLIHGGVRYLQTVFSLDPRAKRKENYELVLEATKEREGMINNIPHLTRYLPTVIPCKGIFSAVYYYLGMKVYTMISQGNDNQMFTCPGPSIMSQDELHKRFPLLASKYTWGVVYYDGEMDDSRVGLESILTSTVDNYVEGFKGANSLNYTKLVEIKKDDQGKITGAVVFDKVKNQNIEVKCKAIVNATGYFADSVRRMDDPLAKQRIVFAKGTHIVLDSSFCPRDYGILIPKTKDGRVLFILPWLHGTVIGTTDDQVPEPVIHPTPTVDDVKQIENNVADAYPKLAEKGLQHYILSNWTGIRPLVLDDNAQNDPEIMNRSGNVKGAIKTSALARTHLTERFPSGLVSIMGGKWTIYRQMGEDGLNAVLDHFEENGLMSQDKIDEARNRSTENLKLMGDYRRKEITGQKVRKIDFDIYHKNLVNQLSNNGVVDDLATLNHFARKYGVRTYDILNIMKNNPDLKEKVHKEYMLTKAEILYFTKYEHSVSPMDILLNRSRIAFYDSESAYALIPHVIDVMGDYHGWDVERKKAEHKSSLEIFEKMNFFNITKTHSENKN